MAGMNKINDGNLIEVEKLLEQIVARDEKMENNFTKDAQVMAIHTAQNYKDDRLILTAKTAQNFRP